MILPKSLRFAAAAVAAIGALVLCGCTAEDDSRLDHAASATARTFDRPNVVLISLDTVRADHCSVYGYPKPTTPNLMRLAQAGAVFDSAYTQTGITGPSHASLFTGRHVLSHGVVKNGLRLRQGASTLAERLREAGYETAAFVSAFPLDRRFGYSQGFDAFDDEFTLDEHTISLLEWEGYALDRAFDRRGDHTTRRALRWIQAERDAIRPFFLFVHLFDAHSPYGPPRESLKAIPRDAESNALKSVVRQYDAEIAFSDQQIGRLLDALDDAALSENTLLIVVADHGEGLMQHGYMQHAANIHEDEVRVPLLMRWVGRIPGGLRIAGPVSLLDVFPTVLDALGVDSEDAEIHGRSLFPALTAGEVPDTERPIHLFRRHYPNGVLHAGWDGLQPDGGPYPPIAVAGEEYGLRVGRWKFIVGAEERKRELFDLEADPGELENLAGAYPDRADSMQRDLEVWIETYRREQAPEALDGFARKALRALGYVE